MTTSRTTTTLERLQIRLASEHESHASAPVLPCPLCFRPALAGDFGPQLRLIEPDPGTPVLASRLAAAAA